eukprot:TRINITY_DN8470_c0_g1_i1.p1 TRINITY_DN8470_c0_g1~~TRINITY_DN8470_c0_g1_i1.p1  ORF type:complete len:625 (-),score=105.41 TRINITY_DN8470_c0_g1_i1:123-1997(-)
MSEQSGDTPPEAYTSPRNEEQPAGDDEPPQESDVPMGVEEVVVNQEYSNVAEQPDVTSVETVAAEDPQPPRPPKGKRGRAAAAEASTAPLSDPNTHKQSGVHHIIPQALKVHPRGFKILSNASPIERSLRRYFRLPTLPTKQFLEAQEKARRAIELNMDRPRKEGTLDGFLLLAVTKVSDPEEATEAILNDQNIQQVVGEDMGFFTRLEFIDLGENHVQFDQLHSLPALQEVHLHCNQLTQLVCPAAAFEKLETLNLSFNSLSGDVFRELSQLPRLSRLDLSCNGITELPEDLSSMTALAQLALENNKLQKPATFTALGTLPSLCEVNLNFNLLNRVPRLKQQGFPALEVMGLASNRFEFFEDLYPLTEYPNLRRVVIWGNAIQRRRKDLEILNYELFQMDVQVVVDGPVPPKRRTGEFYAATRAKPITVDESDLKRRLRRPQRQPQDLMFVAPTPAPQPAPQPPEDSGSAFFITAINSEGRLPTKPEFPSASDLGHSSGTLIGRHGTGKPFSAPLEQTGSVVAMQHFEANAEAAAAALQELLDEDPDAPPTSTTHLRRGKLRPPRTIQHSNVRSAIKELKRVLQHPPAPVGLAEDQHFTKPTKASLAGRRLSVSAAARAGAVL